VARTKGRLFIVYKRKAKTLLATQAGLLSTDRPGARRNGKNSTRFPSASIDFTYENALFVREIGAFSSIKRRGQDPTELTKARHRG
jgi:hypothetical protein